MKEPQVSKYKGIVRFEIPVTDINPLDWLAWQDQAFKTYWSTGDGQFEMAGAGTADLISGDESFQFKTLLDRIHKNLAASSTGVRYYGGTRFDGKQKAGTSWQRFGAYAFVVPQFEVVRRKDELRFACNFRNNGENGFQKIQSALQKIRFEHTEKRPKEIILIDRKDLPAKIDWVKDIKRALREFNSGKLQKVVLARKSVFRFSQNLEPLSLLKALKNANPRAFHFYFQPENKLAFLGATPERLYHRLGREIRSDAVAGTRPRGKTAQEDAHFRHELLSSDKDRREHEFVFQWVRDVLTKMCETLQFDSKATIIQQPAVQHLHRHFNGVLRESISDGDLLAGLHPTPAVGGFPTKLAMENIARNEPFDRGWYAGPVGWIGHDEAEFAVAIRSGLVDGARLSLFSGAGIVPESNPLSEWDEIESKISNFLIIMNRH